VGGIARGAKTVASVLAATVVLLAGTWKAAAQPTTPEAAQFESVNATDMVNLATGDLGYTLPVMEVPGPEGSYPLTLSYHSGIGPNQNATWVGLGGALNPGTINRMARGYPDEYAGGRRVYTTTTAKDVDSRLSVGVYAGVPFGQVGFNASFSADEGFAGARASVLVSPPVGDSPVSPSVGFSVGTSGFNARAGVSFAGSEGIGGSVGVSGGASGLSGNVGVSAQGEGVQGSVGASIGQGGLSPQAGISGAGTVDSKSAVSVGFTVSEGGVGFSASTLTRNDENAEFSTAARGSGQFSSSGFSIPIPIGQTGAFVTLGFSQTKWTLNERTREKGYGYARLGAYLENGQSKSLRDPEPDAKKTFERQRQGRRLYPTPDYYQVTAEGLGGTFRPYRQRPYTLVDKKGDNDNAIVRSEGARDENVVYRFRNERGGNLAVEDAVDLGKSIEQLEGMEESSWYGARRIDPHYGPEERRIKGFTITTASGKRYVYSEPVYSLYEFSYTKDTDVGDEDPLESSTSKRRAYPSQWRLTAVLGPDYVDRGKTGVTEEGVDLSGIGEGDYGVGALLAEKHEEWSTSRRYLKTDKFYDWLDEQADTEATDIQAEPTNHTLQPA
jgi:hypothetical protein